MCVCVSEVDYDPDVFVENLSPASIFSSAFLRPAETLECLFVWFSLCLFVLFRNNVQTSAERTNTRPLTSDDTLFIMKHQLTKQTRDTEREDEDDDDEEDELKKGEKSLPYNIWFLKKIQSFI